MINKFPAIMFALMFLCSGCDQSVDSASSSRSNQAGSTNAAVCSQVHDVKIGQYGDLLIYLPLYIADSEGLFAAECLNVTLMNGGSDDRTYAAVSRGDAQFGVADPTFVAIAREKGQQASLIGTIVAGAPYWGVTYRADIPATTNLSDLGNLRIATYEETSTNHVLIKNALQEANVSKVELVKGSYGTLLAMLQANQADIAVELEPTVSTAVANGASIVFGYPELVGPIMLTGIYTLDSYRQQNPQIVQAVVNALEKAMHLAHSKPDIARAVGYAKFPEILPNVIDQAIQRMLDSKTLPVSTELNRDGWHKAVRVRSQVRDLSKPEQADSVLADEYWQAAQQSSN